MKRAVLAFLVAPLLAYAQEYSSFGGVWIGQSSYSDGEPSFNVGSFMFARAPLLKGLHFGYGVSANTSYLNQTATSVFPAIETLSITAVAAHIPFEVNLAFVGGIGKLRGWAGGGLNLSIAQASMDLSYFYYDGSTGYTCNARVTGDTKSTPGAQIFAGGEYIFGGLPYIGGNWGAFAQVKYMYVRKVKMEISGTFECTDIIYGATVSQNISRSVDIDLSNTSFVVGMSYHF